MSDDKYKILIADDSKISRIILQSEVSNIENLEIKIANGGVEAMEVASQFEPHLIVSDFAMPDLDGVMLCKKLRHIKSLESIPYILISASMDDELTANALESGVTETLIKPFKPYELSKKIKKYMDQHFGVYEQDVLICDNSKVSKKILISYLSDMNFRVHSCTGFEDALRTLNETKIDLIFVGEEIEGMTGIELCTKLKQEGEFKRIPVIGISSHEGDTLKYLKAGAEDHIRKPFTREEIMIRTKKQIKNIVLEHELQEIIKKEKALNHQKNKLLGMAAHDIRNPTTLTICFLEMAKKQELSESAMRAVDVALKNARQTLELLGDILNVSSIESGVVKYQEENLDLKKLIEEKISLMNEIASEKSIEISMKLNFSKDLKVECVGDKNCLGQVVENLLSNAIKYSHPKTKICVILSKEQEGWLVQIQDRGQGIPEDELEHIFNEFKKTSVQSTAGESSTGLGLAIVKKLVERHGGVCWAESEVGKGSCFSFTLPSLSQVKS